MATESEIRTIQDRIASLIEARDYFSAASIEVSRQYKGNIATMIAEKLANLGFGVIVALGKGERASDLSENYYETAEFIVTPCENGVTNSTGLTACIAVEEIIKAIEGKSVVDGNPQWLFRVTGHEPADTGKASIDAHRIYVKCDELHLF